MMKRSTTVYDAHVSNRRHPVNLTKEDTHLFEHEFSKEINKTELIEFRNANLLKDTIFSLKGFKFYKSLSHIYEVPNKKLNKKLFLFLLPSVRIDQGIWITDEWSHEYFHWFTDALPRLLVAEQFADKQTVILPESFKSKPYVQQSLELLGFEAYYYNRKKRLSVGQLFTATHTAPVGNYNQEILNKVRNRFLKAGTTAPQRKIFISRQKAPKRKITNEAAVNVLLVHYGYEVHYFEDYDLRQQIEIMGQTKFLIGLHGAGLTNMLFMNKGGKVLELRNENDDHNNCYFSMASALDHDYFHLLNSGNTADTNKVDIEVDLDKLKKIIEQMEQV